VHAIQVAQHFQIRPMLRIGKDRLVVRDFGLYK
jgi:hypothetical protein